MEQLLHFHPRTIQGTVPSDWGNLLRTLSPRNGCGALPHLPPKKSAQMFFLAEDSLSQASSDAGMIILPEGAFFPLEKMNEWLYVSGFYQGNGSPLGRTMRLVRGHNWLKHIASFLSSNPTFILMTFYWFIIMG